MLSAGTAYQSPTKVSRRKGCSLCCELMEVLSLGCTADRPMEGLMQLFMSVSVCYASRTLVTYKGGSGVSPTPRCYLTLVTTGEFRMIDS